ncbi:MAG TPA: RING finger protein [Nitrosarchaeum sp.]|nr:RING finger protein [Nitrosarchaeum sp.]
MEVQLKCVKEGSKLRIKIVSQGYFNDANCQFHRNIRKEGCFYTVPSSDITLVSASKNFYRIKKNNIKIVEEHTEVVLEKVYGDDEEKCVICLVGDKEWVIVPCGHYILCGECDGAVKHSHITLCPICRETIIKTVKYNTIV